MDEEDERSAYYSSVQDPSADDSVSPLSHHLLDEIRHLALDHAVCTLLYWLQSGQRILL